MPASSPLPQIDRRRSRRIAGLSPEHNQAQQQHGTVQHLAPRQKKRAKKKSETKPNRKPQSPQEAARRPTRPKGARASKQQLPKTTRSAEGRLRARRKHTQPPLSPQTQSRVLSSTNTGRWVQKLRGQFPPDNPDVVRDSIELPELDDQTRAVRRSSQPYSRALEPHPIPYPSPPPWDEDMAASSEDSMIRSTPNEERVAESQAQTTGQVTNTTAKARDKARNEARYTSERLLSRRIYAKERKDERTPIFTEMIKTSLPEVSEHEVRAIQEAAQAVVDKFSDCQDSVEVLALMNKLSVMIDEKKDAIRYPFIAPIYFSTNMDCCLGENEAPLQRSIMMNLFHTHWLPKSICWNTEGQWNDLPPYGLPSDSTSRLPQPRPDLSFSYRDDAFVGPEEFHTIPNQELRIGISPEGNYRWFPFFFLEAKKSDTSLQPVELVNLHSASRALYGIWKWMRLADMEKEFYDDVRVFGVAFNATVFNARIYRAQWLKEQHQLGFYFEKIVSDAPLKSRGGLDAGFELCILVNSIVKDFGVSKLFPLLKKAFVKVCRMGPERVNERQRKFQADLVRHQLTLDSGESPANADNSEGPANADNSEGSANADSPDPLYQDDEDGNITAVEDDEDRHITAVDDVQPRKRKTHQPKSRGPGKKQKPGDGVSNSTGISQNFERTNLDAQSAGSGRRTRKTGKKA